jgi:hypothetical protein
MVYLKTSLGIRVIQSVPGGKVNILGGHSIGHSKQKLYMYMCPIPNGTVQFQNCFGKKEILRTVSNTGIYCSSDKLGKVYLV